MPEPTTPTRILLVGHCGPDSYALRSAIRLAVPGASVDFAADDAAAHKPADLLLVNRVLDGDFDSTDGVEFIRSLKGTPKAMLISNYADAQAEAQKAGALPGFGKKAMNSDEAKRLLTQALNK